MLDTVDLGIVLCTCKSCRIFLDGVDSFPSLRLGECDDIAACTCKTVYQYCLVDRSGFGDMARYSARSVSINTRDTRYWKLHSNWLRSHSKPGIICHPYTLVIFREDTKALMIVSAQKVRILSGNIKMISHRLLNIPRYLTDVWVMLECSWRRLTLTHFQSSLRPLRRLIRKVLNNASKA